MVSAQIWIKNEDGSIGSLADVLWQSTVWYFWWD